MTVLFTEGFDKYGFTIGNDTVVAQLFLGGEWNSCSGGNIVNGLSGSVNNYAYQLSSNTVATRTLATNYNRLIGGVRFSLSALPSAGGNGPAVANFLDVGTAQCCITFDASGHILFKNGSVTSATIIATSTVNVSATSVHYIEFDIAFSATGAYTIWLDGVSILTGTGNTITTANSYANQFGFTNPTTSIPSLSVDDVYLFSSAGARNNAALLTAPRIETTFPVSDGVVQFGIGASSFGSSYRHAAFDGGFSNANNQFWVRSFVPTRACTVNSLSFLPSATNAGINIRGIIYTDSASVPNTLVASGTTVTGLLSGIVANLPFASPPTLTAGTTYWFGFMCDIAVAGSMSVSDNNTGGRQATVTFSSGAPSTAPVTGNYADMPLWVNITLSAPVNNYEMRQPIPLPNQAINFTSDSTVGHEDLFNMNALSTTPSNIYVVVAKAYASKSDTGARTISAHLKSGATDVAGVSVAPPTTFGWTACYTETDPATSATWTLTGVNAAQGGYKIDS